MNVTLVFDCCTSQISLIDGNGFEDLLPGIWLYEQVVVVKQRNGHSFSVIYQNYIEQIFIKQGSTVFDQTSAAKLFFIY